VEQKNNPRWKRMCFKGNKVWLSLDNNGEPVEKNGKFLIKYQKKQDYEYWVHKDSIKIISPENLKKQTQKKETEYKHDPELKEKAICIFTDGASSGNPGPSGIGILLRYKDYKKKISEHIGIATNNIAELTAIKVGLKNVKNKKLPVRLYTDSGYAHGVLVNNWKPKKNNKLIQSIKKLMESFVDLKIIKVKGHAGIKDNETADSLATSAVNK
jgi:ribonuclease HI